MERRALGQRGSAPGDRDRHLGGAVPPRQAVGRRLTSFASKPLDVGSSGISWLLNDGATAEDPVPRGYRLAAGGREGAGRAAHHRERRDGDGAGDEGGRRDGRHPGRRRPDPSAQDAGLPAAVQAHRRGLDAPRSRGSEDGDGARAAGRGPFPGGAARRHDRRADPAHERWRVRGAHLPSTLRSAAGLPREGARRSRREDAGPAQGGGAGRGRPAVRGPRACDRRGQQRLDRGDAPRREEARGAAAARGGGPSRLEAEARGHRAGHRPRARAGPVPASHAGRDQGSSAREGRGPAVAQAEAPRAGSPPEEPRRSRGRRNRGSATASDDRRFRRRRAPTAVPPTGERRPAVPPQFDAARPAVPPDRERGLRCRRSAGLRRRPDRRSTTPRRASPRPGTGSRPGHPPATGGRGQGRPPRRGRPAR